MQIEITRQIPQTEIIDVNLPYYYRHDLMPECGYSVIYGKIEETLCTSIHETEYDNVEKYEIEREGYQSIKNGGVSSYFNKEYVSCKEEFEAARQRCLLFLDYLQTKELEDDKF